ncbi:MAG: DUF1697 domain-containing protein [Rubrobacter sp.]|nr:DUF1697 domain-containing protein [Rubrobacter sp.]
MRTWVALFRGVNVGGNNILPMKELVATLENVGCEDVETYIQSGNTVFRNEEEDASLLSDRIRAAIEESHGFKPRVLVLGSEELERAVRSNPFPEAESEPKSLHVYFLASSPERPDLDALERIKGDRERFVLGDGIFYLHAPDGVGRSRLAANTEKLLGVSATARNWRTVRKLSAMARQRD